MHISQGTYFVRDGYPLSDYTRKRITYYQWVPVILALQAFCFYTPYFIWKTVNMASGNFEIVTAPDNVFHSVFRTSCRFNSL